MKAMKGSSTKPVRLQAPAIDPLAQVDGRIAALDSQLAKLQKRQDECSQAELIAEDAAISSARENIWSELRQLRERRVRLLAGVPDIEPDPPANPDRLAALEARLAALEARAAAQQAGDLGARAGLPAPTLKPDERKTPQVAGSPSQERAWSELVDQVDTDSTWSADFAGYRKMVTQAVQSVTAAYSGDTADAVVAIRQKEYWCLLDLIAAALAEIRTDQRTAKALFNRLHALEARADKSRSSLAYGGVWQRAISYQEGDVVSHGGSAWVALRKTVKGEEPGAVPAAFQLLVKRGADGKDAASEGRRA